MTILFPHRSFFLVALYGTDSRSSVAESTTTAYGGYDDKEQDHDNHGNKDFSCPGVALAVLLPFLVAVIPQAHVVLH